MFNVPLTRETLEYIHEHPEEHNQGWWAAPRGIITTGACGSVACFAGHAVRLAGAELLGFTGGDESRCLYEGQVWEIPDLAEKLLGLTERQATLLFYWAHSEEDLWSLARTFSGGAIQPPAGLSQTGTKRVPEQGIIPAAEAHGA